jgi:hypothetical protein
MEDVRTRLITDDDPVKGRSILAKYQIYLYLVKSCVRRSIYRYIRLSDINYQMYWIQYNKIQFTVRRNSYILAQASATYGTRAKRGTQNDFQWQAE